jgi:hypothetical protein
MFPMSPELAFELHTARNVELQKLARRQGLARSTVSPGRRSHTIVHIWTLRMLRTWRRLMPKAA